MEIVECGQPWTTRGSWNWNWNWNWNWKDGLRFVVDFSSRVAAFDRRRSGSSGRARATSAATATASTRRRRRPPRPTAPVPTTRWGASSSQQNIVHFRVPSLRVEWLITRQQRLYSIVVHFSWLLFSIYWFRWNMKNMGTNLSWFLISDFSCTLIHSTIFMDLNLTRLKPGGRL